MRVLALVWRHVLIKGQSATPTASLPVRIACTHYWARRPNVPRRLSLGACLHDWFCCGSGGLAMGSAFITPAQLCHCSGSLCQALRIVKLGWHPAASSFFFP